VKFGTIVAMLFAMLVSGEGQNRAPELGELSHKWAAYYAGVYEVPLELVNAVIEEESGWNPYAVSDKGAAGLMQLMPETAHRFGVRDCFNIAENIRGGVAYLAFLMREFKGDLRLVTAAYYVGEGVIEPRGLDYSCRDVHAYVSRVATRYRSFRGFSEADRK
jgi:soluble lytic murein transglycosylase-like protein